MTFVHGASAYTNHKCRCDVCKLGKSKQNREYRELNREKLLRDAKRRREENPEYMRRYREEHKDEIRQKTQYWRKRNLEKVRQQHQRSYDKHRDKRIAKTKEWYENNRAKAALYHKKRNAKDDGEASRVRSRQWYEENRARAAAYHRALRETPEGQAAARRRSAQFAHRVSAIPSDRNGEPWTLAEFAIVKRDDLSVIEMAAILHRSYGSVSGARASLKKPAP